MAKPDFDSIKHLNPYNVEYWEARELMPLLGYGNKWQNFVDVIKKAMISCETTGNIVTDHFTAGSKMVEIGSRAQRGIQDYYLSRLACYLIAMNGDSRKPEIAAAQNYFAVTTRAHEIHQLRQEREARIQIRLEVAEGNKQLSEAAVEAGVRSQMFGVFHDAGYLGQYTLDAENIRIYKGIPEGGEILDYMGREELAANLFRITQTEGRLRREQVVGEDAAIQAHYRVGREVRDTLKRLGATMPEDLPTAESIRGELERQRRARQKIQKQQQKDQDTLF
jgi:DNA-damage-inducible protein D